MKVKVIRDFVGFVVDDDLMVQKDDLLDVSDEVAAFLIENLVAEKASKPNLKAKPKPAPKK